MLHILMLTFIAACALAALTGTAWFVVWCTGRGPNWIYSGGPGGQADLGE